MIRQRNYEVGPELIARFTEAAADDARFFKPSAREGYALFDLAGLIGARLRRAGIERIEDAGNCTYADASRFYSYRRATHRREPDYGRHISAIAISA
jgi:copper oxidase (laccase) domain-containing protein